LQYKILTSGQGHNNPKPSDGVSIRYRITSLDGKPLLSSPLELAPKYPLKALISGWREVLQLMKPGDKWQLFMPPALAFEKTGNRDGKILPYQTVISELELVAIVPIEEAQAELQHQDKAHSSAEIHFKPSHE
jgi:FKBP-type peptidyl-prolyl cis-trans isomerase